MQHVCSAVAPVIRVQGLEKRFLKVRGFTEVLLSIRIIAWVVSRIPFLRRFLECETVLADVSFSVQQGTVFGLFGVNGSGKSTLLYCLADLLSPENGTIEIHGKSPAEWGSALGSVIAKCNRNELYHVFTAMENVEFVALLHGLDVAQAKATARTLLTGLGMSVPDQETKLVGRLSMGTKGKVALICSLIPMLRQREEGAQAPILLLDEPTYGFDVISVEEFFSTIEVLRKLLPALTVVIASNDLREAAFCDDYIALVDGRAEHDQSKLEHLKRSVGHAKEALRDFAAVIGRKDALKDKENGRHGNEAPAIQQIERAKRPTIHKAFTWRAWRDLVRYPVIGLMSVTLLVLPNLIGLAASESQRGRWQALVMTVFGIFVTFMVREFHRLYERERSWYRMLELVLLAPVSRLQHIVYANSFSWWSQFGYTVLAGVLLTVLVGRGVENDLAVVAQSRTWMQWGGVVLVVAGVSLAALALGLLVSLLPFTTRSDQSFFLIAMIPTLSILCGGIYSSPQSLPIGLSGVSLANPVTYASAAFAELLGIDLGYRTAAGEWLAGHFPSLGYTGANLVVLYVLSFAYLALAALVVRYGERHLRRIGRMRYTNGE